MSGSTSSAGACCRSCGDDESSALRVNAPRYDEEIVPGQDLAELLLTLVSGLEDGDIVVVSSKAVAKAEGRVVEVGEDPWERQRLIEQETVREVAWRDTPLGRVSVVENRLGVVGAAAGIDMSNVASGSAVLLPVDPDASARRIRADLRRLTGRNTAVVVTDTLGRPWRIGQTDVAIGCAGMLPLLDLSGTVDPYGNTLKVTAPAVADEVAAAAELAMGKVNGRPMAVVTGLSRLVLPADHDGPGARAILRPAEEDWFRQGSREAWEAGYRAGMAGAAGEP